MPNEGKQNRAEGKRFQLALHAAIAEASQETGTDKWSALKAVAAALLKSANEGNIQAIKEVADRLDGKSVQGVELSGKDGKDLVIGVKKYAR